MREVFSSNIVRNTGPSVIRGFPQTFQSGKDSNDSVVQPAVPTVMPGDGDRRKQSVVTKQSRGNDASNGKAPSTFADTLSLGCYIKLSTCQEFSQEHLARTLCDNAISYPSVHTYCTALHSGGSTERLSNEITARGRN